MDIEKETLSAMMLNSDNLAMATERGVTKDWFFRHGHVYEALTKIEGTWNERNHLNILAPIFAKFDSAIDICENTPPWAFKVEEMEDALEVLAGEHAQRTLLTNIATAHAQLNSGEDPFEVAGKLVDVSEDVETLGYNGKERTTEQLVDEALEIDRKVVEGAKLGLPFPWIDFQRRTFGIPNKALTPLGGRDGKGKSRLMTFLAEFWTSQGIPILYFPFEDGAERFISNVAATHGEYDMFTARRDFVPHDFLPKHEATMERVKKFPLYVEDYPCTAERIVSTIARYKRKFDIQGVVIDGLKDVIPTTGENQTAKENHITATLIRACKKYDVVGIAVSHLTDLEDNKWISKRNIRGSKTQSQSSRMVLMYQDAGIPSGLKEQYGFIDDCVVLDAQKTSYGSPGMVVLRPELERGRFVEVKREEEG